MHLSIFAGLCYHYHYLILEFLATQMKPHTHE